MCDAADGIEALKARAAELQALGEWSAEALEINEAILAAEPRDVAAGVRRGRCLRALGRIEDSLAAFDALRRLHPQSAVVASQHRKASAVQAARRRAEQLLAQDPRELADALERSKAAERDIEFQIEGRRLLARHEQTVESTCALAAAQRRARDYDGALNTYRRAAGQPGSAHGHAMASVGLAAVLRDLRRLNEAEALLRGVLEHDARDGHAALGLAAVLMDRVEHERKAELVDEVRRILGGLYARGIRDDAVRSAYARLDSLSSR